MPPIISDVTLRNAKPQDKAYRLQVGGNCFLEVLTDGVKWWRMRYRRPQTGQQAILDLGFYRSELVDRKGSVNGLANLSLNEAKAEAIEAKKLLKRGIDPQDYREEQKARIEAERQATLRAQAHSFETITREWHTHRRDSLNRWKSAKNAEKILHMLEVNLFPDLGALHISEVTAPLLLETIQKVVNRGAVETAKKLNRWTVDIFRYAVLRKLVAHNEADNLRGEIPAPLRKNNPYLKAPEIGNFIRQVEADTGGEIIKLAILLTLHCLTRTQETRFAQWSEFDEERRKMMDWWSDYLNGVEQGAHIIPIRSAK